MDAYGGLKEVATVVAASTPDSDKPALSYVPESELLVSQL